MPAEEVSGLSSVEAVLGEVAFAREEAEGGLGDDDVRVALELADRACFFYYYYYYFCIQT